MDYHREIELEGSDITPLLADPRASWDKPAICTFGPNNHSLRSERYRYTVYADGSEELYDHETDPNEWTNLSREEWIKVIGTLRGHRPNA